MKQIKVISPGLFSSLQDAGRKGFAQWGIPTGGALDVRSMHRANAILGNPLHAAIIESTFIGPLLSFDSPAAIAICGAEVEAFVNDEAIQLNERVVLAAGDRLRIGKCSEGARSYLAIEGGFETKELLGSKSWTKGLTAPFRLSKGDVLAFGKRIVDAVSFEPIEPTNLDSLHLEVLPGPEFSWLNATQQEQLFDNSFFLLPTSDRMAFSFEGTPLLPFTENQFLTSPVLPGTIQWYPNGQLVLLHRDAQRTGGYPRILLLDEESLNQIAQIPIRQPFYLKTP